MFALDLFNTKYERKLQEGAVDNSEAYQDKKSRLTEEAQALHAGDPVVVTAPNEFEGATGEIHELSPSGSFVVVDLYNHGRHSMHLSDVAYNDYADQEEEDDWYDEEMEEGLGNWMGKVADKAFGPGSPAEISGFAGDKAYAQHYETRAYPEAIQMIAQGGGIGQQRTNANVARAERQLQQIYRDKGVELTKQNYAQLVTNKIKADVAKAMGQQGIAENSERVDPILIKALNNMPDGLNSHGQVLNAAYDAYAMELGKMRMKSEYGTTNVYVPKLMGLYKDKHGLTFNEAETLSNPQHKLGKDIDAGRKSDEASRIRADKARAEFNKQWDEKKATEKPGVEEAGEWPDKMSHDDLENMQRNHQKWSEQDTPSRTDPSATVEDFYHEVVRLGPGLGRDLLYFAAEEGDEPPHIVKAARQLYKKIARKAGLNPEIGGPDNNEVFDLMYDWVGKNYSNPGEQGVAEGIFDRFKKTPKKESYSRQDFYQWLDKVQEQLASGEDIDEVIYNLESSLEKIYTDDVVAQFKGQIWDSLDLEMYEQGVTESAGRDEYYIWTVHFANPEKNPPRRIRVYSDEFVEELEHIKKFYAKQGLTVVDVDTNTGLARESVAEEFKGNVKDTQLKNVDPDNHSQGEGDFVKNQLHTMKRVITHLDNAIGGGEDLPDWVQSEIAQAVDKIVGVMDYSISSKEQQIEKQQGGSALMKEGSQSFHNGMQVKLTPEYADRPDEVFTVAHCDRERGRCWIGDEQGRGWSASFDQLIPVEDDEVDEDSTNFKAYRVPELNRSLPGISTAAQKTSQVMNLKQNQPYVKRLIPSPTGHLQVSVDAKMIGQQDGGAIIKGNTVDTSGRRAYAKPWSVHIDHEGNIIAQDLSRLNDDELAVVEYNLVTRNRLLQPNQIAHAVAESRVLAEKQKEKKDSQATQDPLLTYHGKEPNVRKVLARAYKETPGAKNDIEAVFGHIANVDEINRQQQQQIIELAKKLIQAQKNYNQQEQRFQELTDKLRQQGNQPTAQDIQAAQIAGQIERKPQAVAENTPRMTAREKLQQAVDREKKRAQDDRTGLSGLDYDDLQRQLRGILDRTRPKKVDEDSDNPAVEQAIARRIMVGRTDLLLKYGPRKVMQAVEQVADYVGSVDEIGSSDVSGWVGQVEQALGGVSEAANPAQQAAIAISMKQQHKKPKKK